MKKTLVTLLTAFAGGLFSVGVYKLVAPEKVHYQFSQSPPVRFSEYTVPPPVGGSDFTYAAESTVNGVVHIKTVMNSNTSSRYSDPFEQFFGSPFGGGRSMPQVGAGSGVIITADGYILTNNHVVNDAREIEVTLNDKRSFRGKVIGADPNTDLAVIRIDAQNLPVVPFGNSDALKLGEWVLAVGNPFNLASTVTAGIVSAKSRNIDIIQENYKIESFIQTDAVVNPGNSGGALVNTSGELVGINTAISTHTGSFEGYSFAVLSNLAKKVAEDIIEFGTVQRGLLGVNIREITYEFANERGIPDLEGVWVEAPLPGSAAEEAGVKSGDIIVKINDAKINSVSALQETVGLYRPGDKLVLTVKRNGKLQTLSVTLKNRSGSTSLVDKPSGNEQLGATFESVPDNEMKRLGIKNGLKVQEVTSGKLRAAGVKPGYIITEINGKAIRNIVDLNNALSAASGYFYIGGVYATGEKVYYSFN